MSHIAASPRGLARVHAAAATLALLCIASFWTATVLVELLGEPAHVALVKRGIVTGLFVLVPALAVTGATGRRLAGPNVRGLLRVKQRRTAIAAAVGLLVLVPAAIMLSHWAGAAERHDAFVGLQVAELLAGALNITLLSRNVRDGRRLARARRAGAAHPAPRYSRDP